MIQQWSRAEYIISDTVADRKTGHKFFPFLHLFSFAPGLCSSLQREVQSIPPPLEI